MKKLISICILLISCHESKTLKDNPQKHVNIMKEHKKLSPILYRENRNNIFVTLKVKGVSADSVLVESNFINNTNEPLLLYKPLLPMNRLENNVFSINIIGQPNALELVPYVGSSSRDMFSDEIDRLVVITPELKPENFISLGAKGFVSFKVNIAKFYNFHIATNQNHNEFQISYLSLMPYVINNKQVFQTDPKDKKIKPVFFAISTNRNPNHVEEMIKFSIPN